MTARTDGAFEAFLVEDVILTLGNIRAMLPWVMDDPSRSRAGLGRLDTQIAQLQDRARDMARALGQTGSPQPSPAMAPAAEAQTAGYLPFDAEETGNVFADIGPVSPSVRAPLSGITLRTAVEDALRGDDAGAARPAPQFRSRRG